MKSIISLPSKLLSSLSPRRRILYICLIILIVGVPAVVLLGRNDAEDSIRKQLPFIGAKYTYDISVVNKVSGQPLAGAEVKIKGFALCAGMYDPDCDGNGPYYRVTDATGKATFRAWEAGGWTFNVSAAGYNDGYGYEEPYDFTKGQERTYITELIKLLPDTAKIKSSEDALAIATKDPQVKEWSKDYGLYLSGNTPVSDNDATWSVDLRRFKLCEAEYQQSPNLPFCKGETMRVVISTADGKVMSRSSLE